MKSTYSFAFLVLFFSAFTSSNAWSLETTLTIRGKTYPVFGVDWYREKTDEIYRTFECDGGVGMKVVKTPNKEYMDKVLSCGGKRTEGKLEYVGPLFNTWDGKTYKGKSYIKEEDPYTLIVKGCVLGGLICQEERLQRMTKE